MVRALQISRRTVYLALERLQEQGLIQKMVGKPAMYTLNFLPEDQAQHETYERRFGQRRVTLWDLIL